jgi:hypothetical protein
MSSAKARGYDERHRILRRNVQETVERGFARCARCGERISPSEPWDLGHDDLDRSKYSGPEHRQCNRATSTHRAQREAQRVPSRSW